MLKCKSKLGDFSIFRKLIKSTEWKDIEHFDEYWKLRIALMAKYVTPCQSVIDLGCGKMWLREYLAKDNTYIPVDYTERGEGTIICDFNKYQYPPYTANIAFVSGCLEYVKNYCWFINQISTSVSSCVISYCTIDRFPDMYQRRKCGWVNSLSKKKLINIFSKNSMKLENYEVHGNIEIFYFKK